MLKTVALVYIHTPYQGGGEKYNVLSFCKA
jgi:hypothetical protein